MDRDVTGPHGDQQQDLTHRAARSRGVALPGFGLQGEMGTGVQDRGSPHATCHMPNSGSRGPSSDLVISRRTTLWQDNIDCLAT